MKNFAALLLIVAFAPLVSAAGGASGRPSIFWASLANDVNMAKYYVSNGGSVNITDEAGMSPLMHAAEKGHLEMVEYLLSVGANACLKASGGSTAIQFVRREAVREALRAQMQNCSNTSTR